MAPTSRTLLRCLPLLLAGVLAGAAPCAAATASLLPPIDGAVSGQAAMTRLPGMPAVRWTLTTRSAGEKRLVHVALDGVGLRLRASAELDAGGNGEWELSEARLDTANWLGAVMERFTPALAGATVTGELNLTGRGTLRNGAVAGTVNLVLDDATLRQSTAGWSLAGIKLHGEFAFEAPPPAGSPPSGQRAAATWPGGLVVRSVAPLEFSIATIATSRLGARNLSLRASLISTRALAVQSAAVEIAGGGMRAEPFEVSLDPLGLSVKLNVDYVGLQDVAALAPGGLTETQGRVDGWVQVGWKAGEGLQLGAGHFALNPREPARVRLAPVPGFLTGRMAEYIPLLPASLGAIGQWFRPRNPAYPEMSRIELGRTALRVRDLSIELTPDGDAHGRTAVVEIHGQPEADDSVVREVSFQVNVAGPLAAVLRMGLQQSFTAEVK